MYERSEDILRLALLMEGSYGGVSLAEIVTEFTVSRRTAERLRDAVGRAFPAMELVPTGERVRRWRLPRGSASRLVEVSASDLEELLLAAEQLRSEGLDARATRMDELRAKLAALLRPEHRARVATDVEALLEAEGYALRPGPRHSLPEGLLDQLRRALLGCRVLEITYRGRAIRRDKLVRIEPHGLLFGQRHYLVAFEVGSRGAEPKLYALSNIVSAETTHENFERRAGFTLRIYAARAFGVYQEKSSEVVWRFAPAFAADALEHHFHPTEHKRQLEDGSLEVTFKAGGEVEMVWHLFTWGSGVEVLAPASLRERYVAMLKDALQASRQNPLDQESPD